MGTTGSDGPAVFSGELYCFMCQCKFSESVLSSVGRRLGNQFFCSLCGRWIGAVVGSFATMSITPFRVLLSKLPPGFYLSLDDDNAQRVTEIILRGTVSLIYKDVAAVAKFPITVHPDEIIKAAEEYLERNPVKE